MTDEPRPQDACAPIGNYYDKYETRNPLSRAIVGNFRRQLDAVWGATDPASQLDCGCGEGVITRGWAERLPDRPFVGVDLDEEALAEEWDSRRMGNLRFMRGSVTELPFSDGEFDLVSGIEMLEHVPDPAAALVEMRRVAARWLLVSVPREPLWRALNLVRGAYVSELGNTPGHVNHWSREAFLGLVRPFGEVVAVKTPLPWTIVLVRTDRSQGALPALEHIEIA